MPDRPRPDLDQPAIARRLDPRDEGWRARTAGPPEPSPYDQHGFRGRLDWGAGRRPRAGARGRPRRRRRRPVVLDRRLDRDRAGRPGGPVPRPATAPPARTRGRSAPRSPARTGPPSGRPCPRRACARCAPGELLVLPSPNGSACAVEAASAGPMVVAGCLRNASAVGGARCRARRLGRGDRGGRALAGRSGCGHRSRTWSVPAPPSTPSSPRRCPRRRGPPWPRSGPSGTGCPGPSPTRPPGASSSRTASSATSTWRPSSTRPTSCPVLVDGVFNGGMG